jgi:Tannase and feruloyl esterase
MTVHRIFYTFVLTAPILLGASGYSQSNPSDITEAACTNLAQLDLLSAKITGAKFVPAGSFAGPPAVFTGQDLSPFYKALPAFCQVQVQAMPTPDSDIKIEVWLPSSGWNGKLQAIGNGGFAGLIDYHQLGIAMGHGYAATATDAGHSGTPVDATWALDHPEKVIDFGHRGIHQMTVISKAVAKALYGREPQRSYFYGCSDGGREALMEAQRYPQDYDGILAGAPANYWTALLSSAIWNTQALTVDPASYISPAKVPAIASAVLIACDALDGANDGVLNDPRQCKFDPSSMLCKAGVDSDKCLTAKQAVALKALYAGPKDSKGRVAFPGYMPGGEDGPGGWGLWIFGPAPTKSLMAFFGIGYFSNMVYGKPDWDYKTFTWDAGYSAATQKTADELNATSADLSAFKKRGGKLILYHGWNDPAIPPLNTINYYQSVTKAMGQSTTDGFVRLYMVPGMQHCGGGPGAGDFGEDGMAPSNAHQNVRVALEQWVEKNIAPGSITATKYEDNDAHHAVMTRPLCRYPAVAKYTGKGDAADAANFTCSKK